MLKLIEGLPEDVLAIEATGTVTHEDYRDALIPKAEAIAAKGPIKVLYVVGPAFTDFELEALWDDAIFGFRHWHDFSHVAVVTDLAWMRAAAALFKPFFRGELRLFGLEELPAAKDWIARAKRAAA